jgi:hypothetical protein
MRGAEPVSSDEALRPSALTQSAEPPAPPGAPRCVVMLLPLLPLAPALAPALPGISLLDLTVTMSACTAADGNGHALQLERPVS